MSTGYALLLFITSLHMFHASCSRFENGKKPVVLKWLYLATAITALIMSGIIVLEAEGTVSKVLFDVSEIVFYGVMLYGTWMLFWV
jgi:hypothetical protein